MCTPFNFFPDSALSKPAGLGLNWLLPGDCRIQSFLVENHFGIILGKVVSRQIKLNPAYEWNYNIGSWLTIELKFAFGEKTGDCKNT